MNASDSDARPTTRYWRRVVLVTVALLFLWLAVTFAGPWFAYDFGRIEIGGVSLGFWMASQGVLIFFVLVIAVYAFVMDRLDAEAGREQDASHE